jgi:hypothetical protein
LALHGKLLTVDILAIRVWPHDAPCVFASMKQMTTFGKTAPIVEPFGIW